MWAKHRPMVEDLWSERALFGATAFAVGWLLGPGAAVVNAILGPATDITGPLTWLEDAAAAPEDAFLRFMTALGLVLAVRLTAALLLALVSWIPGPTAAGAARLGRFLAPPLARRFIDVIVGISLTSGASIALTAPALAATQPAATAIPSPVLAPPEAILQTWPDLGRPGTDVPTFSAPHARVQNWPDLGRPGTNVPAPAAPASPAPSSPMPSSSVPRPTKSPAPPSSNAPRSLPSTARPPGPSAATMPSPSSPIASSSTEAAPRPEIVVTPGDCLWTFAERGLENRGSTEPSDSEIAAATEKWWQTNRTAIGENPDRLLPGQRLLPPA